MGDEMKWKSFSHVWLFVSPWTVACQTLLSTGFSRQEYWSGLSYPPSRGSSQPWDQTQVSALQADSLPSEPQGDERTQRFWVLKILTSNSLWNWCQTCHTSFLHSLKVLGGKAEMHDPGPFYVCVCVYVVYPNLVNVSQLQLSFQCISSSKCWVLQARSRAWTLADSLW